MKGKFKRAKRVPRVESPDTQLLWIWRQDGGAPIRGGAPDDGTDPDGYLPRETRNSPRLVQRLERNAAANALLNP